MWRTKYKSNDQADSWFVNQDVALQICLARNLHPPIMPPIFTAQC